MSVLKLCLFPQLLSGRYRDTQTSITDSSAVYRVSQDKVSAQPQPCPSSACSLSLLPVLNLGIFCAAQPQLGLSAGQDFSMLRKFGCTGVC